MGDPNIPDAPPIPGATGTCTRGKVRDLYRLDEGEHAGALLMVASDRISAFDFVLDTTIPDKGEILTRMSLWWFDQLADLVPDHVLSTDVPGAVTRSCGGLRAADMFPVECVARGYLTGSGLLDYRATGEVCGIALPEGLEDGSRLPEPIFTPATKAALGDHDENVSYDAVVAEVGADVAAHAARPHPRRSTPSPSASPASAGSSWPTPSSSSGPASDGTIVLGDEVLTPDSRRFWPADDWQPGRAQPSYDKQIVRDWLLSAASGWDRASGDRPPALPAEVVERTRSRYVEAYERLTGERF